MQHRSRGAAPGHDELRNENLDDLAVLVSRLVAHADRSTIRARARWSHLFDFAADGQLISPPVPMIPPRSGRPDSTSSFIVMAAVCQPLAAKPPNSVGFAASPSR